VNNAADSSSAPEARLVAVLILETVVARAKIHETGKIPSRAQHYLICSLSSAEGSLASA
jgi:hypothetical protein